MAQVSTLDSDYADVTLWREHSGHYTVQCERWPDGNAADADEDGNLPEPTTNHFSIQFFSVKEATACQYDWFDQADVEGSIDDFLGDDQRVSR
jgi:hypothetical protein